MWKSVLLPHPQAVDVTHVILTSMALISFVFPPVLLEEWASSLSVGYDSLKGLIFLSLDIKNGHKIFWKKTYYKLSSRARCIDRA